MHLLLASLLFATSQALTVEDYATLPSLSSPRFSPDGKRIVYVVTRADLARSIYDSDLFLIDADGRNNIQITRGSGADFRPRWSPDGNWIAFLSDREGRNAIWILNSAGGEAVRLTSESTAIRDFEWSPEGRWIAYTALDAISEEEEKRMRDRDDARVVGEGRKHYHLYGIEVESRAVHRLTRGDFSINNFSFSPDGKQLAVERLPGTGLDDLYNADLYLLDAQGTCDAVCPTLDPLVVRPGIDRMPRFAPDGKRVAFLSGGGVHDWLREHMISVVDLKNGRTPRTIGSGYDRTPDDLAWSADAKSIVFHGRLNSTAQIFRINADGSNYRNLSHVDGVIDDADVDVRGERAVFVYQTLITPPDLYVSSLGSFTPRQLTRHNDLYRGRQLGATRLIRWKNPKDGLEIEGLLTLPVGYERGRRVPLLTFVHGGPASQFDQAFLGYLGHVYAPQALAAAGFAVLRPNPRGTGGYGTKFRQANRADWGGMDWIDINAGIDAVIEQGIADPNRLGMMGWSYGGFISTWAISRSDRFKAISIGAPVVDLLSFHGTSDIRDFIPSYFPPMALDLLRTHSPLWHLKKTSAAVLIQHGESDDRVPLSQGTMLYRLLSEMGVNVTMVTYPRTPHVPREPKLRMDVARRNLEFFTRALLAGGQ